jgi:hypothetical protein
MDQEPVDFPDALDESPEALREAIARTRRDLARHIAALRDHLLTPRLILTAIEDISMVAQKKQLRSSPSRGKKLPDEPKEKRPDTQASRARSAEDTRGSKKAAANGTAKSSKKATAGEARPANGSKAHHGGDSRKSKSSSSRGRKRAEKSLLEKAGEVVDPVLAGAVVGAVTGAARQIAHEPGALPLVADPSAHAAGAEGHEKPTTREVLGEMAPGAALGAVTGAAKSILPAEPAAKAGKKRPKGHS